jgi:hypothetical protein
MELQNDSAVNSGSCSQGPGTPKLQTWCLEECISSNAHGQPKLAELIGDEGGWAIFRRFGPLSAKNLIYLRAELLRLEYQVAVLDKESHASGDGGVRGQSWGVSMTF